MRLEQRLVSPFLEEPLAVTGTLAPLELALSTSPENQLRVSSGEGALAAAGSLALNVGPAQVQLTDSDAADTWLNLTLAAASAPDLALRGTLPNTPLQTWLPEVLGGFTLSGIRGAEGSVTVQAQPAPRAALDALRWSTELGTLELSGAAVPGDVDIQGVWRGAENVSATDTTFLPWLAEVRALPFELEVAGTRAEVTAAGGVGTLDASFDWAANTAALNADLSLGLNETTGEADSETVDRDG